MPVADAVQMLKNLDSADYESAVNYIIFLTDSKKKRKAEKSIEALQEMNALFADDKGWNSEEEMIRDMAEFRKSRTKA